MAFHTYLSEGVNASVIECGIGGQYDCTNVIEKPKATAITSLGIDHTAMLGTTIEQIAWHKGGIIKSGVRGFAAPQPPSAEEVWPNGLKKSPQSWTLLLIIQISVLALAKSSSDWQVTSSIPMHLWRLQQRQKS